MLVGAAMMAAVTMTGVQAAPERSQPDQRPGGRLSRLADLNLTDEQKATVKETFQKHQPAVKPLVDKLVTERRALQDLIHAEKLDESAIRAQAAKVAAVEADLAVERAKIAQELRPVLTAEQIQKLQEMKSEFRGRLDGARERIGKRLAGG
jgi:protein CpxP